MRIREVARATGVSAQTIHFYLREGLLTPPVKTAPNMAYYSPQHVEDIRLIKELKEKRYLPLAVIKLVLEAKRQGKDIGQLQDMRLSLDELFRPLGPEEALDPVTLTELVAMAGLPAATVDELAEMGLLTPVETPQGKRFDGLDVRVARTIKGLLDLGLAAADLTFYRQYLEVCRTEARVVQEKLFHRPEGWPQTTGSEVRQLLDNLKASLAAKVYRRAVIELHRGEGVAHSRLSGVRRRRR